MILVSGDRGRLELFNISQIQSWPLFVCVRVRELCACMQKCVYVNVCDRVSGCVFVCVLFISTFVSVCLVNIISLLTHTLRHLNKGK